MTSTIAHFVCLYLLIFFVVIRMELIAASIKRNNETIQRNFMAIEAWINSRECEKSCPTEDIKKPERDAYLEKALKGLAEQLKEAKDGDNDTRY